MTTTVWPAVVDSMLSGLRALDGYRAPDGVSGVPVFDGWEHGVSGEVGTTVDGDDVPVCAWVTVGWAGDPEQTEGSGESGQSVHALAASTRPKHETGAVRCCVEASWGDAEPSRVRAVAFGVLADIEEWIRGTTPALGVAGVRTADITAVTVEQQPTELGVFCRIVFAVSYEARLG